MDEKELGRIMANHLTPEEILALQPSSVLQERVTELLAKAKLRPLSDQEEAELDGCFRLEHLVRLAKGQAQAVS